MSKKEYELLTLGHPDSNKYKFPRRKVCMFCGGNEFIHKVGQMHEFQANEGSE